MALVDVSEEVKAGIAVLADTAVFNDDAAAALFDVALDVVLSVKVRCMQCSAPLRPQHFALPIALASLCATRGVLSYVEDVFFSLCHHFAPYHLRTDRGCIGHYTGACLCRQDVPQGSLPRRRRRAARGGAHERRGARVQVRVVGVDFDFIFIVFYFMLSCFIFC